MRCAHIENPIRGQKAEHPADRVDWKPSYPDDGLISLRLTRVAGRKALCAYVDIVSPLASLGSCGSIGGDIRHLIMFKEVEEPFEQGQVSS